MVPVAYLCKMAAIVESVVSGYHDLIHERSDPRANRLPLLGGGPWPVLLVLLAYHRFVGSLGPRLMKTRPPVDIRYPMMVYNFVQIGVNGLLVYKSFELKWLHEGFHLSCDPVDYSDDPRALAVVWYSWIYYLVKILDLLDTVFMVLRKKGGQVTFLHRYHHVAAGWIGAKYVGGGHSVFFGTVNSFVHIAMYTHYQVALIKPDYIGRHPWWKKHITQLQLVQFVALIAYYSIVLLNPGCNYPMFAIVVFIPQHIFMLFLFLDFYKKAYKTRCSDQAMKSEKDTQS